MAKHFQQQRDTFQFGRRFFFNLETERFLRIIILDIYLAKSDWNWQVLLKTGVWAILSAFAQMSKAIGDVSTSQCFWGYGYTWNWVSYYDDDATISHKLKAVTANSLRAISLREVTCEWQAKQDMRGRCGKREWELPISSAPHGLAAHSLVRLLLEMAMERLLSVHNN